MRLCATLFVLLISIPARAWDPEAPKPIPIQTSFFAPEEFQTVAEFRGHPQAKLERAAGQLAFTTGPARTRRKGIECTRGMGEFHILQDESGNYSVIRANGETKSLDLPKGTRFELGSERFVREYDGYKILLGRSVSQKGSTAAGFDYYKVSRDGSFERVGSALVDLSNQTEAGMASLSRRPVASAFTPVEEVAPTLKKELRVFERLEAKNPIYVPSSMDPTFPFRFRNALAELKNFYRARLEPDEVAFITLPNTKETQLHLRSFFEQALLLKIHRSQLEVNDFDPILDDTRELHRFIDEGGALTLWVEDENQIRIHALDRSSTHRIPDILRTPKFCRLYFRPFLN